ncbi:flavin-containing monooxygenase [Streptomyces sp. SP18CS02]|uniref:flavin-containing monooxygenase n=1 Tax=Streptomyces sp. SP18CS02 TaxID=3002531 RepID=UPI002E76E928|nr:NAD(P)/FAD-dependent oxidoreductase [Streptomyces sp. SP18CS02]MEE1757439.1 NAD(P)/FAD-dependent oxidoreductase [Streptomyces sp. SP18CS02]
MCEGTSARHVRVAVIGAGLSGLGVAARLRSEGLRDFVVLERSGGIGGTWRDNTYPGSACDVPAHLYSYSFAPHPGWPRVFSRQEHIRAYLEDVADRHGLRQHLKLGRDVQLMRWNAARTHWEISTTRGRWTADVVVCATGPLSEPSLPTIAGLESFRGHAVHSARWDPRIDLRGKRVAVIGNGASAVQIVPAIAPMVRELRLFQRTPAWVVPRLDRRITGLEQWLHRRAPVTAAARRAVAWGIREVMTRAFTRLPAGLALFEAMALAHLNRAVEDPELRDKLTPDYRIGCKRILVSSTFYPALTLPHVKVITSAVAEVRGSTLIAWDGTHTDADVIIFGTGFRATDPPIAHRVVGAGGATLAEAWRGGMRALRGSTVAGFPNFLTMLGPNTGLGNSSLVLMIESQLNYLMDYLRVLDGAGPGAALAPRGEAVHAWNAEVDRRLRRTVWSTGGCSSWYMDPRGRNTTLWPGSTLEFRRATRRIVRSEYELCARPYSDPAGAAPALPDRADPPRPAGASGRAGRPVCSA